MKELDELNRIRLEEDLSYLRLARLTGISDRALYRMLNTPGANVYDRTLFKIRRFLESRSEARRPKAAAR